ncbi:hypothetical protein AMS62_09745 [Bacillus sp. FJAT-18019]|nr:hypothetical protein AMS62_09745 [Bacillus sp. FJAT-18019]
MTLLISWLGVDSRGPASAYIASDSRISWGKYGAFDYGKKVFAFNNYPDIIGYCGDVLFPSIILSQIIEMGDSGLLFSPEYTSKQRFEIIKDRILQSFFKYPHHLTGIVNDIQIIYISRDLSNKDFFCHTIEWRRDGGWNFRKINLPNESDILFCLGSGAREFKENYKRYQEGPNTSTSRNVFHCFCDTLSNIKDTYCGGAPQLVGVYRKPGSGGIRYGIIKDKKRYFYGAEVYSATNYDSIEWRNDLFERCDGFSMRRKDGAMEQPDGLRRS